MATQPVQHISDLLFKLARQLKQHSQGHTLKFDLTTAQLETLWYIGTNDQTTMDRIATYLNIKPPSATALIDRMEREGYVERVQDKKDRRITNVHLTPRVEQEFATLQAQKEATFNKLMARLSESDQAAFMRILAQLTADE